MSEIDTHVHQYRSPLAAIIGLVDVACLREDLDSALVKQLRAIRALAQDALEADETSRARARDPLERDEHDEEVS